MSADTNWNLRETDFPKDGSPREKIGFVLKYVLLTSADDSWQPWQYRAGTDCVELFAHDPNRPEASDPDDREAFINCGACLCYLKLALRHFGCLGRLELFPDLDRPALVARVFAGFGRERDAQESALFATLAGERINTSPLDERPVSTATLDLLRYAAMGERAWLEFAQSEFSRQRLLGLAAAARQPPPGAARRVRNEFLFPTTSRSGTAQSTITVNRPVATPGSGQAGSFLALSVRTSGAGQLAVEPEGESAAMAVVKSRTDDKSGWVAAGQAAARILLYARVSGLSWTFLNQALRNRTAREELLTVLGRKGFPQIVIRFGSRIPLATSQPVTAPSFMVASHR